MRRLNGRADSCGCVARTLRRFLHLASVAGRTIEATMILGIAGGAGRGIAGPRRGASIEQAPGRAPRRRDRGKAASRQARAPAAGARTAASPSASPSDSRRPDCVHGPAGRLGPTRRSRQRLHHVESTSRLVRACASTRRAWRHRAMRRAHAQRTAGSSATHPVPIRHAPRRSSAHPRHASRSEHAGRPRAGCEATQRGFPAATKPPAKSAACRRRRRMARPLHYPSRETVRPRPA